MKLLSKITLLALAFILAAGSTKTIAQVSFGTDVVSRYVWRGIDFGQSLSFQPGIAYASGSFEIGAWGSYANDIGVANELDLFASYSFDLDDASSLSIGVTDYYFPAAPGTFTTFDTDGNHVIEPFLSYSGAFSFTAYMNILNDPDNSIYLSASYPFEVEDVSLEAFLGFIPGESAWYGNTSAAVQEIGLSASKEITITESFSLPVFTSYIINPYQEISFLFFGISL
ncbi:MAG: hypothetical protein NXI08_06910 [bacterium]|nr:hypothetical protein [bacterium]